MGIGSGPQELEIFLGLLELGFGQLDRHRVLFQVAGVSVDLRVR